MADPSAEATRRVFLTSVGAGSALGIAQSLVAAGEPAKPAPDKKQLEKKPDMKPSLADLKAELDDYGFVVLKELIPRQNAARLAERVKELMSPAADDGKPERHLPGFFNHIEPDDDALFLPLVTQPIFLELAKSLLGERFQMTETGCRWRKPGAPDGPIHGTRPLDSIDRAGLPAPNVCFVLAFSWMLNDLTSDMGATLYLPFSHHVPHGPRAGVDYKHLLAVEAPAGSVIVHHGGLWHRFGANTSDRDRVGLMGGFFPFWMDPVSVGWQPMKKSVRNRMPAEVQEMNVHVIDG